MPHTRWSLAALAVVGVVLACGDSGPAPPVLSSLSPNSLRIPQGSSRFVVPFDDTGLAIAPEQVRFSSTDTSIATVDSTGRVTASGHAGTTGVLATTPEGDTAVATVEVQVVLTGLAVEPESVFVRMGGRVDLRAWGLDWFGDTVTVPVRFRAKDADVVGASGPDWHVVPYRPGSTTLTVTIADGWPELQRRIPVEVGLDTALLVHMTLPGKPWDVVVDDAGVAYVSLRDPGQVVRLDPDDYSIQATIALPDEPVPIALDSAGTTLYAGVTRGEAIVVIDPVTMTERYRMAVPGAPVAFVLDEARASLHVVTQSDGMFRMLLPAGDVVDSAPTGGAAPIALDVLGGMVLLATYSLPPPDSGNWLLAFNALDYTSRVVFEAGHQPASVAAARSTRTAIVGYYKGMDRYDLVTGVRTRRVTSGGICGLGLGAAETEFYAIGSGTIYILSFPDAIPIQAVYLGGSPCRLAVDPRNGRLLVPNGHGWLDVVVPSWR
ncbi:MAG: Ig-like domain-containing protein [Gemmatimonadota bacterium]|nr:Ig-like domain-containing protein [Gemmatimonadota bacterium]